MDPRKESYLWGMVHGALVAIAVFIFLAVGTGCASTEPYAQVRVGYQINELSDWWYSALHATPTGNQLGQPWVFQGEVGLEWEGQLSCGWQHESRLLDGGPFNNNPELYREMVFCSKRFGGWQ